MPHKRNPVLTENLTGLSRIIRSSVIPMMENITLWHERDISHSSVERIICPDTLVLLDFSINRLKNIVKNLVVNDVRMKKNLEDTKGLFNSQKVMLCLIKKGNSRENSYKLVQKIAMKSWEKNISFKKLLLESKEIRKFLSTKDINEIFDLSYHFKNIDKIFNRVLG